MFTLLRSYLKICNNLKRLARDREGNDVGIEESRECWSDSQLNRGIGTNGLLSVETGNGNSRWSGELREAARCWLHPSRSGGRLVLVGATVRVGGAGWGARTCHRQVSFEVRLGADESGTSGYGGHGIRAGANTMRASA